MGTIRGKEKRQCMITCTYIDKYCTKYNNICYMQMWETATTTKQTDEQRMPYGLLYGHNVLNKYNSQQVNN